MPTDYPDQLDNFTNPQPTDPRTNPSLAQLISNANDAIAALQATLGTNPQGTEDTVRERLEAIQPIPDVIEHVTFDMEGLLRSKNPPVPGVRLGNKVIPAGSLVIATVYVTQPFSTSGINNPQLRPIVRSPDGETGLALVDASLLSASQAIPGAIKSVVDFEDSAMVTDEMHLGAGIWDESTHSLGQLNDPINASQTSIVVVGLPLGLTLDVPVLIKVGEEIMNVTAHPGGSSLTVQRGQSGTTATAHEAGTPVTLLEPLDDGGTLLSGEAYIAFWIRGSHSATGDGGGGGDPGPSGAASINMLLDGGGSVIETGLKGFVHVPFNATLVGADLLADQSGSLVVDVWKSAYANHPPNDSGSITGSAPPTLSSALKSTDSTLAGWTTSLDEGDILAFHVDSATTITLATVVLRLERV